jgi:hypothetical protein
MLCMLGRKQLKVALQLQLENLDRQIGGKELGPLQSTLDARATPRVQQTGNCSYPLCQSPTYLRAANLRQRRSAESNTLL